MFRYFKQSYFIHINKGEYNMKLILEDSDLELMKKYKNGEFVMLYNEPGNYSLNFTITDPIKANLFLLNFLSPYAGNEEKIGLEVTSLNLYQAIPYDYLKDLKESLKNINMMLESKGI